MNLAENKTAAAVPGKGADWSSAPLHSLMDHIVGIHHEYLKLELPRLADEAGRLVKSRIEKYGDSSLVPLLDTFLELKSELESHMWKEEVVLFPLIRNMEAAATVGVKAPPAHCGSVNNPIRVMEYEHASAERALEEMRRITGNYALPEGACETHRMLFEALRVLEEDLCRHIRLENDILHPRASELEMLVS